MLCAVVLGFIAVTITKTIAWLAVANDCCGRTGRFMAPANTILLAILRDKSASISCDSGRFLYASGEWRAK